MGNVKLYVKIRNIKDRLFKFIKIYNYIRPKKYNRNIYYKIKKSKYWNEDYYLSEYKYQNKEEPLIHYLETGWKEGKNPSTEFHTSFYLDHNPDVKNANINPLVHYILHGENEERAPMATEPQHRNAREIASFFAIQRKEAYTHIERPMDIIVPVYNGADYLSSLFESIVQHTLIPYRLLICNDKSSDDRVEAILRKLPEKYPEVNMQILSNKENLGFIQTVNRLVELTENHFVILNTDVEVPSGWLARLMFPIVNMPHVATTTPFTNAGTICSFPEYLSDNAMMDNLSVEEVDNFFKDVNFGRTYIEIPTGVGFCMGVNKELVSKIGMFDTIFGKGYAEENDFCQRAIQEGYKNIHVTNLFVYHKHGGSFQAEEKECLLENNLKILDKKHPTYHKQVQTTIRDNKLQDLRDILYFRIKSSQTYTTLLFDHSLGGGTNYYADIKIKKSLSQNQTVCAVRHFWRAKNRLECRLMDRAKTFTFYAETYEELREVLQYFFFNEIFVNSLVSFFDISKAVDTILYLQSITQTQIIIPLHDYFSICPSYTLLNHDEVYCGIPKNLNTCVHCLKQTKGEFKQFGYGEDIEKWREYWYRLFERSSSIICFSSAAREVFLEAYPDFIDKLLLKPHDISGKYPDIYRPKRNKKKIIGILGGINIAKGAKVIRNLVAHIEKNKIDAKVVLIGEISSSFKSSVFMKTGKYKSEELPYLVKNTGITEFLIPSIWPETYSYVTDEIMQMGYPLTVFDIGAPAERVRNYQRGQVIGMDELYEHLFGFDKNDEN